MSVKENKKSKTFKDRYQNKDFKEKHLKYIQEKLACECGLMVSRVAIAKHRRTKKHLKAVEAIEAKKPVEHTDVKIDEAIDFFETMLEALRSKQKYMKDNDTPIEQPPHDPYLSDIDTPKDE